MVTSIVLELLPDLEEGLLDLFFDLWLQLVLDVVQLKLLTLEEVERVPDLGIRYISLLLTLVIQTHSDLVRSCALCRVVGLSTLGRNLLGSRLLVDLHILDVLKVGGGLALLEVGLGLHGSELASLEPVRQQRLLLVT